MKIIAESSLTSKEQLTLPLAIRRILGVKAGDSLVWGLDDQGQITVEAGRPHTLEDVRAAVAAARPELPAGKRATVEGMKAGIADAMRRKHEGR
jgi:bifunctional DNA-binding transcriptional regulator/antitoxin component of YhaV-PrlF toxin-antitoxin module